jgi:hypothetical protein
MWAWNENRVYVWKKIGRGDVVFLYRRDVLKVLLDVENMCRGRSRCRCKRWKVIERHKRYSRKLQ